jgi:SAM-dependent methyltransferase
MSATTEHGPRVATLPNIDPATVRGFGQEWSRFDQSGLGYKEEARRVRVFDDYFRLFPWADLPGGAEGFDAGCGSGRWAKLVAPRVGRLHCVDASPDALAVASRNLAGHPNCALHVGSVEAIPVPDCSQDFGYSLGVLHHIPDTEGALAGCVAKLKPGAPFLVYLYYAFENRPAWFRTVWRLTDLARRAVSRLPFQLKTLFADLAAVSVYWPLARAARLAEQRGKNVERVPLASYRNKSFYTMRTDALDRFGTRLEKRFTGAETQRMMESAGLVRVQVYGPPYWCAVGYKGEKCP